jgi:hypothetical protein
MLCQKETLFKSPDDEHCVLETCRELKKWTYWKSALSWLLTGITINVRFKMRWHSCNFSNGPATQLCILFCNGTLTAET